MKATISCLVLLTVISTSAAPPQQQLEVKARLTSAAKNITVMPTVTTVEGATAQVRITKENALQDGSTLPSGILLNFKSKIIDGRVAYSGLLTVREKTASEDKAEHTQIDFSTTEMLFSGVSDSGQQIQLALPDKSILELTITTVNLDGTPTKKS